MESVYGHRKIKRYNGFHLRSNFPFRTEFRVVLRARVVQDASALNLCAQQLGNISVESRTERTQVKSVVVSGPELHNGIR